METHLNRILEKANDYKMCTHCKSINWYENQECLNCGRDRFYENKKHIVQWAKGEYDFLINKLKFSEMDADNFVCRI